MASVRNFDRIVVNCRFSKVILAILGILVISPLVIFLLLLSLLFVCLSLFAKMQFGRSYTSNSLDLGNIPTCYLFLAIVVAVRLFVIVLPHLP